MTQWDVVAVCPPCQAGQRPAVPQGAGGKGRRPGLLQSWGKLSRACFPLPEGCFIPKLRPWMHFHLRLGTEIRPGGPGRAQVLAKLHQAVWKRALLLPQGCRYCPGSCKSVPLDMAWALCSWLSLIASLLFSSPSLVLLELAAASASSPCGVAGAPCAGSAAEERKPGRGRGVSAGCPHNTDGHGKLAAHREAVAPLCFPH